MSGHREFFLAAWELFGIPDRVSDGEGQVGRFRWDIWRGSDVGRGSPVLCERCDAATLATSVLVTDALGAPASFLALCEAHGHPERWMAREWRELKRS